LARNGKFEVKFSPPSLTSCRGVQIFSSHHSFLSPPGIVTRTLGWMSYKSHMFSKYKIVLGVLVFKLLKKREWEIKHPEFDCVSISRILHYFDLFIDTVLFVSVVNQHFCFPVFWSIHFKPVSLSEY
jgi:hypothetical protein